MTVSAISRRGFVPAFLLALALGGCAGGGGDGGFQTFELLAPQEFTDARKARGTLAIALPTTIRVIDSERVVIQPTSPSEVLSQYGCRIRERGRPRRSTVATVHQTIRCAMATKASSTTMVVHRSRSTTVVE